MSSCSLICPNENENIIKISIKCKMVDNVPQWTKDGEVISVVDIEKHKCAGFLYKVKIFLTGVKFTTLTSWWGVGWVDTMVTVWSAMQRKDGNQNKNQGLQQPSTTVWRSSVSRSGKRNRGLWISRMYWWVVCWIDLEIYFVFFS